MILRFLLSLTLLSAGALSAAGASLKNAEVRHALNDVRIDDKAARTRLPEAREILSEGSAILTGAQSRAELIFPDRTLARIGSDTSLRSKPGTRDLLLDRGTLLLQVPRFRGGTRILTGPLIGSAGGATVLIEHLPGSSVKVVVLEGDFRISVTGFLGDSIVIPPGKMLITKPKVPRIPDPVDVDIRTLAHTSSLIASTLFRGGTDIAVAPLPSMPLIAKTIDRQAAQVKGRALFPTNLMIRGSGTTVMIPGAPATAPDHSEETAPPLPGSDAATGARSVVTAERGAEFPPE